MSCLLSGRPFSPARIIGCAILATWRESSDPRQLKWMVSSAVTRFFRQKRAGLSVRLGRGRQGPEFRCPKPAPYQRADAASLGLKTDAPIERAIAPISSPR